MKVLYDNKLKIAGVGVYPWVRLGPQIWFDDYRIASLFDWDVTGIDDVKVYSLYKYIGKQIHLRKQNTPALLSNPNFIQMLKEFFSDYTMLTYKPVQPPEELLSYKIKFLSDETKMGLSRKFENKAWFRRRFIDRGININIPDFGIYKRKDLSANSQTVRQILNGRDSVVLQDATLSGGKGTFIVRDLTSLRVALNTLEKNKSASEDLVVSDYISGAAERSVQGVVTRYGVFIGPMQQQIIANPLLANQDSPGAELFCGTQISMDDSVLWAYDEQKQNALTIGEELRKEGYRGIFGVDSLVANKKVYTIEVNPRITGATPLLTINYDAERHIPFYLLHILELIDADYQISDISYDNTYEDCALMIPHSLKNKEVVLKNTIRSGLYSSKLEFENDHIEFDSKNILHPQLLLQSYVSLGKKVKPGGRLLSGFANYKIIDDNGELYPSAEEALRELMKKIDIDEDKDISK